MKLKAFLVVLMAGFLTTTMVTEAEAVWPFKKKKQTDYTQNKVVKHTKRRGLLSRMGGSIKRKVASSISKCNSMSANRLDRWRLCVKKYVKNLDQKAFFALTSTGAIQKKSIQLRTFDLDLFRRWKDISLAFNIVYKQLQEKKDEIISINEELNNTPDDSNEENTGGISGFFQKMKNDIKGALGMVSDRDKQKMKLMLNQELFDDLLEQLKDLLYQYQQLQIDVHEAEVEQKLTESVSGKSESDDDFTPDPIRYPDSDNEDEDNENDDRDGKLTKSSEINPDDEEDPEETLEEKLNNMIPLNTIPSPNPLNPVFVPVVTKTVQLMAESTWADIQNLAQKNPNALQTFCDNFLLVDGGYSSAYTRQASSGYITDDDVKAQKANLVYRMSTMCSQASIDGMLYRAISSLCVPGQTSTRIAACTGFDGNQVAKSLYNGSSSSNTSNY